MSNPCCSQSSVEQAAILEVNLLRWLDLIPETPFEGARIEETGARIFGDDKTGDELYSHLLLLDKNELRAGFLNIARNSIFGTPLLRVGEELLQSFPDDRESFGDFLLQLRGAEGLLRTTSTRFISYSFPKQGIRIGPGGEGNLLDRGSLTSVPINPTRSALDPPSVFEGWSLLEETPEKEKKLREERFGRRVKLWEGVAAKVSIEKLGRVISAAAFQEYIAGPLGLERNLFAKQRRGVGFTDDPFCDAGLFMRPQERDPWCVPASLQMVLEHFRYRYSQQELAQALRLDNGGAGFPLPVRDSQHAAELADARTESALDTSWIPYPQWTDFADAIGKFRPMLSFVWGHARVAAGVLRAEVRGCSEVEKEKSILQALEGLVLEGLIIFDPWPVGGGTRVWWENFEVLRHWLGISFGVTRDLNLGNIQRRQGTIGEAFQDIAKHIDNRFRFKVGI